MSLSSCTFQRIVLSLCSQGSASGTLLNTPIPDDVRVGDFLHTNVKNICYKAYLTLFSSIYLFIYNKIAIFASDLNNNTL